MQITLCEMGGVHFAPILPIIFREFHVFGCFITCDPENIAFQRQYTIKEFFAAYFLVTLPHGIRVKNSPGSPSVLTDNELTVISFSVALVAAKYVHNRQRRALRDM